VLSTDQKGATAETAIALAAIKLGLGVYQPLVDGERYDLILDIGTRLLRVQCKWAKRCGDVLVVRCYSARRTREGLTKRSYTADEIDAFAAYCADLDQCYFLPLERFAGRTAIQLRL
jgi:PD-(D/E)XK nuclease superfamily protein